MTKKNMPLDICDDLVDVILSYLPHADKYLLSKGHYLSAVNSLTPAKLKAALSIQRGRGLLPIVYTDNMILINEAVYTSIFPEDPVLFMKCINAHEKIHVNAVPKDICADDALVIMDRYQMNYYYPPSAYARLVNIIGRDPYPRDASYISDIDEPLVDKITFNSELWNGLDIAAIYSHTSDLHVHDFDYMGDDLHNDMIVAVNHVLTDRAKIALMTDIITMFSEEINKTRCRHLPKIGGEYDW